MGLSFFNVWAILVVILIRMILGALWYSNLFFGKKRLELLGKSIEEISREESNKAMSFAFIPVVAK